MRIEMNFEHLTLKWHASSSCQCQSVNLESEYFIADNIGIELKSAVPLVI
jgi:hypothetical protein